jgi:hypothetical protein
LPIVDGFLERSRETPLDVLVYGLLDCLCSRICKSKRSRLFDCQCLINQLMPNHEIPCEVDRRTDEVPFELGEGRETRGEVKADGGFVVVRNGEIFCKRSIDFIGELGQSAIVRRQLKKRYLTLDRL